MAITIPLHQFEIRYTKILNFSCLIQEAIAPFIPMALNVQVERENTVNCRYSLFFQGYFIIITWDRILIIYEGEIKGLNESNSIIEEPFFNLYNKIKELKVFGNALNCLSNTIIINHTEKKQEDNIKDFCEKYLIKSNIEKIISNPSDATIILEKKINEKQIILQYGPYNGIEDLNNRNVLPQSKDIITQLDKYGEMLDIKIFEPLKAISFLKYKEHLKMTLDYQNSLWKK
ncbi:MAG: hypothetical protein COZ21_08160 [Bacteroidetes bacterium CG_4_10_14_3_um_filter_31_20]|nr:MAG: hypothetical protein COZ59_01230 [Bacteroidetes bacterium CG_4_8_14_3_um_filter_31_14]PIY03863.1 MAG: hypothetical protein COZ21_08160 [Bacteroidetes bacterium CG_4_10_14_3_um_filter_31_20]